MVFRFVLLAVMLGIMPATPSWAVQQESVDQRRVPTGQQLTPAGDLLTLAGRPNDLARSQDGKWLFVKSHKTLQVVDLQQWKLEQELPLVGGASLCGIVVDQEDQVYVSNAKNQILKFARVEDTWQAKGTIDLPDDSFPCGMCWEHPTKLWVCLSKKNQVVSVDVTTGQVEKAWDVGISPFQICRSGDKIWVSNLGGRRAAAGDTTAPSAGTETPVDSRGIANTGSVTFWNVGRPESMTQVPVGLHPSALLDLGRDTVAVCNTNDDSVSILRDGKILGQVETHPLADLPFGSMPNAIGMLADGRVVVGLAGNNAIAVYQITEPRDAKGWQLQSLIPTAWFPTAVVADDQYLYVANLKGIGSRADVRPESQGRNSHDHLGAVQRVALADVATQAQLYQQQVRQQAQLLPVRQRELQEKDQVVAVPIPERLGDPSVFQHVIYVIKENRTYDQVFGDMPEGRGEPSLCTFPEKNTPNHHALARRFGLLDNYYCNGVLSADGHSWATEGNVTPYLERAFGGFARSYTFGDDPLTYSSSGFLWDHVLAAGLSFRNYGEMDYAKPPAGMDYQAIWKAFEDGKAIPFQQNIGIEKLRRYSCPDYPGWGMMIPDVLRVSRFLKEFRQFEKDGMLPNLSIVYLPQDHLGGGVTSAAHMADNDLALGQLVQAVSQSGYWKNTLIIVNEDDPQNGYDHIDGHRSVCLAISAYSKPGANHHFYNQTSVLRTILHIFGLPPMNQQQARSPLMTQCFADQPDLSAFEAMPANVPLNQAPADVEKQSQREIKWRQILATVPIQRTGMKTEEDEDHLNRFVWHEMKGWDTPYPTEWSGGHGRGLKTLGLELDPEHDE